MVVINPSAMPKPSLSSTCTTGARQLVVQEALETMWWLAAIVEVIVDAHHDSEVFALGRCGDDHLFGAGLDVALGFLGGGEQAGGLDHDVHAEFLPRQAAGLAGADHFHLVAVDDDCVIPADG